MKNKVTPICAVENNRTLWDGNSTRAPKRCHGSLCFFWKQRKREPALRKESGRHRVHERKPAWEMAGACTRASEGRGRGGAGRARADVGRRERAARRGRTCARADVGRREGTLAGGGRRERTRASRRPTRSREPRERAAAGASRRPARSRAGGAVYGRRIGLKVRKPSALIPC